ncbi:MAG: hypothetical protein IJT49_05265 [Clostridia bacterium]|nr:hypothetical protein [Clostridia bacterium]
MKRILQFICVLLCAATVLSCAAAFFAAGKRYDKNAYGSEGEGRDTNIPLGTCYGVRLGINGEFTAVSVRLSTYTKSDSKATVELYKWADNYDDTVRSAPVASKQFDPVKDNLKHTMEFDAQPKGEYLILVTNDYSQLCVWKWETNDAGHGLVYADGAEGKGDINVTVSFTSDVTDPFFEVEPSYSTGDVTVPDQYVPDSDSAVIARASHPTTWAATDELGRTLPTYEDAGGVKDDKIVALFYWSWHVSQDGGEPLNVQKVMDEHPESINDYNNSVWPTSPTVHFWNESIYGYYKTNDRWVLRRHAELLADAGVDVIFFDNTNGTFTFKDSYQHIFEVFEEAYNDGVNVPKISFLLPFGDQKSAETQMRMLYQDIYQRGRYQKLWFYFDGKPMVMCSREFMQRDDDLNAAIKEFFTFRAPQPGYKTQAKIRDMWGWLSVYPQTRYLAKGKSDVEQITVGVAVNHNYVTHQLSAMNGENIIGRTYTSKGIDTQPDAVKYGANFAEQFEYAISVDPKVIFITGWNEWIAGRYDEWCGVKNAFPDEFNDEFSRDIEPTKGRLRDNYYYQMVYYIRKFKGCEKTPVYTDKKTIDLNGGSSQWDNVQAVYTAYQNNTGNRDAKGYGSYYYTDQSGRNDFTDAAVTSDNEYIYFTVKCAADITPYTDRNWMNLYIDSDDGNTGWETFDYVIGKKQAEKDRAYLQKFTGNGFDTVDVSAVDYSVDGDRMTVRVAKKDIGITDKDYRLCFKWTDNVQDEDGSGEFKGEILDFYRTGDVAPGGRFKYVYTFKDDGAEPEHTLDTETETETNTDDRTDGKTNNTNTVIIVAASAVAVIAVIIIIVMVTRKKK